MKNINVKIGIVFFIAYLIIGFLTLPHYGINWDEPAHYLRGQAFLHFFLTGDKDYKSLPPFNQYNEEDDSVFSTDIKRSIYQKDYYNFHYWEEDFGHPPLSDIIGAFFNYVFFQNLNVFGDIESYHLYTILISSSVVYVLYYWISSTYGRLAALVAVLSMILYPLFFAESHFNIKDPVVTSFYVWTIFAFYKGATTNNWKWMIGSALFFAFGIGTKFNIFFAGATIFFWLLIYKWREARKFKWPFSRSLTISLIFYPLIPIAISFLAYPPLWDNPFFGFLKILAYYREVGFGVLYQPESFLTVLGINTYPFQAIIYSTPLIILFLSAVGIFYVLRFGFQEKTKMSFLILVWFLIPIIRVSVPNAGIYGGVRQIMEYIPAMAIISGIGAKYIVSLLHDFIVGRIKQLTNRTIKQLFISRLRLLFQLIIVVSFIPITLKLISIHPNQNVYFNPLIGGLKGASEKNFPDWGVTLGSVYKQGVLWLNKNAEENAKLVLVRGLLSNVPIITLRRDINFSHRYFSGEEQGGEYIMEVTDYSFFRHVPIEKRLYLEKLNPVYEVRIDDVSILTIWKNDKKYLKP